VRPVVAKKPRPVTVKTLRREPPPNGALVSASVASWKTEEIGFEVGGRVEWVAEPNTSIEGRVIDGDGNVIIEGTPVAAIESERYQLHVDSAKAELARAKQNVEVAIIELEKSLPSQLRAAEIERDLAQTELNRSQRLKDQNAGSQADVDRGAANYETALSRIEQIEATRKAKVADIESLRFQVKQAEQALRDAQRNLEDCTLYSSFRGQVANIAVVPGSVVTSGQPVATVQMMDPIKIEVEVSAEDSQRLSKRQRLTLLVKHADGSVQMHDGFLYLVDPVADLSTRTFTLTLLMLNQNTRHSSDAGNNESVAVTDQAWRTLFSFLPGADQGLTFAIEEAIHADELGPFVWKIENFRVGESMPKDRLAKVSKLRVRLGSTKLPFLGNWLFQQIEFPNDEFDAEQDLIAGKLSGIDGPVSQWDGDEILIERSSPWLVRPGDIVQVDLSDEDAEPGFFVPMDAISQSGDKHYLFVIDKSADQTIARRVEIVLAEKRQDSRLSSLLRIQAADDAIDLDGVQFVTQGTHYLVDLEPVNVIATSQSGATR
tara:strand:+ start:67568 stop:69202 length:1635 start_codon:yes stop_codon:yes gene_type:complete